MSEPVLKCYTCECDLDEGEPPYQVGDEWYCAAHADDEEYEGRREAACREADIPAEGRR
jgi:hypothetical protein